MKFLFKLFIEQTVNKVDLAKAILGFPVDLAFLSISFAAILLPQMQTRTVNPLATKDIIFWFVLYVVTAFVVTVLSKKSDSAFVLDNHYAAIGFIVPAYFVSIFVIVLSLLSIG